jgi:hypothetical protein
MEKRSHLPLSPVGKSSSEMRKSWRNVMKNNLLIFFYSFFPKENKYYQVSFFSLSKYLDSSFILQCEVR